MAGAGVDLKIGDVGTYSEIIARPNPHAYTVVHIPSLTSVLIAAERKKGKPLTEKEALAVRDNAGVMVLPDKGQLLEESNGYKDIDPIHCWQEWQVERVQFNH